MSGPADDLVTCADCRRLTVCSAEICGEPVCPSCATAPRCGGCYVQLSATQLDGDYCEDCERAWDAYMKEGYT